MLQIGSFTDDGNEVRFDGLARIPQATLALGESRLVRLSFLCCKS